MSIQLIYSTGVQRRPTFREERRDGKAEEDGGETVEKEKDEGERRLAVVKHGPYPKVQVEEYRHDNDDEDHEDEVVDEPCAPVNPALQAHHFHGFLAQRFTKKTKNKKNKPLRLKADPRIGPCYDVDSYSVYNVYVSATMQNP